MIFENRIQDGIHNNLNKVIKYLTDTSLSSYDIEILKYGLKLGVRSKELEMIVFMGNIYDQIMGHSVVKDSYVSKDWLKTTLKAFTIKYLDIDDKWYFHYNNV